jgi:hypothetical protein
MTRLRLIGGLASIAVATLAIAGAATGARTAEDKRMERTITISASAQVAAEPDLARLSSGVTSEADTAREALNRNTEAMRKLIAGLKTLGIDAKDIQTGQFQVEPRYTNPRDGKPPAINGYRVVNTVNVVARDLKRLGEVLDQLVTLGSNQMQGLQFDVSKAETLKDEARKEAIANALRRAKLYAAAAGAEVGAVIAISEEVAHVDHPRPMLRGRAAMAEAVPVEAGSQLLEARVTVTWALK